MVLESFNTLSLAKSALKTDKLLIIVTQKSPPSFSEELTPQILTAGQASSWSLPAIQTSSYPLTRIDFQANLDIESALSFDSEALEVSFSGGDHLKGNNGQIFTSINFDLVDSAGLIASYSQVVIVYQAAQ